MSWSVGWRSYCYHRTSPRWISPTRCGRLERWAVSRRNASWRCWRCIYLYICIHTYIHTYILHVYIHTYIHAYIMHVYIYTIYIYIYIHTHTHTHTYIHTYVPKYINIYRGDWRRYGESSRAWTFQTFCGGLRR